MSFKSIFSAVVTFAALFASPASATLFDFRITLDPGTPSGGSQFIQTFNSSLNQGPSSYQDFGDRIEERRSMFGSATAYDNALLVALGAETGTTGSVFFDAFTASQLIFDNRVFPKSYSYGISFSDQRVVEEALSPTLYRIGDLKVTITGNSATDDPASPLTGFYLDSPANVRTVLRNTQLRFSAVGTVYTYDTTSNQVVQLVSQSRYSGIASLVPEPAGWALMIGGFGFVGAVQRQRKMSVTMPDRLCDRRALN